MNHESEYQAYDDDELTRLLADDVDTHFPKVVWKYTGKLKRFAGYTFRMHEMDVEECVQDAMLRGFYALKRYSRQRILDLKLKPWLYKIAQNECKKYLDKESRRPSSVMPIDDLNNPILKELVARITEQPEFVAQRKECAEAFWRAFQELSQNEQLVLILSFVDDMTYAEIGIQLNKAENTIKVLVFRARKKLHKILGDDCK